MNPIELSIFSHRINAVCEEMGAQLQKAAFSPNIRDRLDFSCAVFDSHGRLCAQAAHIPVHIGSMAFAMQEIITMISWCEGDLVALNDPFLGGTHLPDVTVICPIFVFGELYGFVANRAHYADIGAELPGSMPISSELIQEGIVLPPTHIGKNFQLDYKKIESLFKSTRNMRDSLGDMAAQSSANKLGVKRLQELIKTTSPKVFLQSLFELNQYGERIARSSIFKIPDGTYEFTDYMEDDGQGNIDIPITVSIKIENESALVDFTHTAKQVIGNINCPISVTAAAVFYVFRCLMPKETPACAGSFMPIKLKVLKGSLLNANRPAAVAAGNVETSSRVVDVVLGALNQALQDRIPACSQGTMNNIALGSSVGEPWGYYETLAGGMGASKISSGLSAKQSHMTNTQNTPAEVLELSYPIRIKRYAIRTASGGEGVHAGGDGLIREFEFLEPATFTILSERRMRSPWGVAGGKDAKAGRNYLNGKHLPAKIHGKIERGDCLRIETPGGGGWGNSV